MPVAAIVGYVTVAATKKTDKKTSQNAQVIKFPFLRWFDETTNQDCAVFLFLTELSQEAHSHST
jgi:hypothetical protein